MARAYNIDPTDAKLNSTQAEREREKLIYKRDNHQHMR